MAITPVQMPSQRPRAQSTIEQIATGVDAAAKILGLGINAYKVFGIDKPASESESAKNMAATNYYNAEAATKNNPYYMNANPQDITSHKSHQIPGPDGSLIDVVPRQQEQYENAGLRMTTGVDDKIEKDAENLQKHLDVSAASSRSPLGKAANNYYAAQRVQTLIDQNPNPTPQQMYEIARSADTILSQSGSTLGGTEHLVPKTAIGDINSWKNYMSNQPGGAGQEEWVKNLRETVMREGELARNQVISKLDAVAKASEGGRLAKTSPERYGRILEGYRSSLLNLSSPLSEQHSTSFDSPASPVHSAEEIQGAKDFISKNPNDPRVPQMKQLLGLP